MYSICICFFVFSHIIKGCDCDFGFHDSNIYLTRFFFCSDNVLTQMPNCCNVFEPFKKNISSMQCNDLFLYFVLINMNKNTTVQYEGISGVFHSCTVIK